MSRGFPEYGARISVDKTLLSFEYETGKQLAPICGANEQGDVGESILQATRLSTDHKQISLIVVF